MQRKHEVLCNCNTNNLFSLIPDYPLNQHHLLLDNGIHPSENHDNVETDLSTNLELLNGKIKALGSLNDKIIDLLEEDEEICADMNEYGDFKGIF